MQTNPMQLSEDLKGVPLQSLMQYAQGANPMVPQWMALTEMARRKSIQQAGQPQAPQGPQPTVKDQLVQQTGLDALQRQRQMAMQQMLGGGGPGMAAGGLVSFAGGGSPFYTDPRWAGPRASQEEAMYGPGQAEILQQELRKQEAVQQEAMARNDFAAATAASKEIARIQRILAVGPANVRTYETPAPPGVSLKPRPEDTNVMGTLQTELQKAQAQAAAAPDEVTRRRFEANVEMLQREIELQRRKKPAQAAAPALAPKAPAGLAGLAAPPQKQEEKDLDAMRRTVTKLGAAGMDIATLLPRGVAGAVESAVTRPLRALGVPIPYLPESFYGGDRNDPFPYMSALEKNLSTIDAAENLRLPVPPPAAPKPPAAAPAPAPTPGWEVVDKRPDAAPAPTEDAGIAALTNLPALTPEQYMTPEALEFLKRRPVSLEERLKEEEARKPKNLLPGMYDEMLAEMRKRRGEATQGQGLEDLIRVLSGAKQGRGGMGKAYTEMQEGRRSAADKLREQEMALRLKQVEAQQAYENGDFARYQKLRDQLEDDALKLAGAQAKLSQEGLQSAERERTGRMATQESARARELTARLAAEQRREAAAQTAAINMAKLREEVAERVTKANPVLAMRAQTAKNPAEAAAAQQELDAKIAAALALAIQSQASGAARKFEVTPRNP